MATFAIQDVYVITGIGPVPVGKVVSGPLSVGMKSHLDGLTIEIRTIERHHQKIDHAETGDNVGIMFNVLNSSPTIQETSFFKKIFSGANDGSSTLKKYIKQTIEFN